MYKLITTNQMCAIIFILFIGNKLLILPSMLYYFAKTDAVLFIIANCILDLLLIALFVYANKKSDKTNIYTRAEIVFGKFITKLLCSIFAVYFLFKIYLVLCETENFLFTTIYTTLGAEWFILPIIAVCLFVVHKGIKNIARTTEVFSLIVFIGVFVSILISLQSVKLDGLLPLGTASGSDWLTMLVKSGMWFGNYFSLFFLTGQVKLEKNSNKKLILAGLISSVVTIVLFSVFYCIFETSSVVHYFAISDIVSFTPTLSSLTKLDWFTVMFYGFAIVMQIILYFYIIVRLVEHILEKKFNFWAYFAFYLIFVVSYIAIAFSIDAVIDFYTNVMDIPCLILNILVPICVVILYTVKVKNVDKFKNFYDKKCIVYRGIKK